MANFVPKFQIWSSNGNTLLYTFTAVQSTNAPQSVTGFVEITNLRSSGSIIIDGGNAPFDIDIGFLIFGVDYTEVTNKIEALENTVGLLTPYLLRIERSDTAGDWFQYNIKRLQPFSYDTSLRNKIQPVTGKFRANSW